VTSNAYPEADRQRDRLDTLAGLMAATAIFVGILGATNLNLSISGTHLEMRPVRIGVAAVVLALISAGIGGRHSRLAAAAVVIAGASWVLGMAIAVITQRPVF
jgi:hypothetical protein